MAYVDGFLIAVPRANKKSYRELAEMTSRLFVECGAKKVVECWGDDVPDGQLTSFPMAVKLQPDEVVVFSWIWWPDKATRDTGTAKFMADPRHTNGGFPAMPFDGKRMVFGGFDVLVET